METETLKWIRRVVAEQPTCEDPWFEEALAEHRAQGEKANRIYGSCLRIVLGIAEGKLNTLSQSRELPEDYLESKLLIFFQTGNEALERALETFTGASAQQFVEHVERTVEHSIELLLQHPVDYEF